ncbi:MAG TPA: hypothetical protein VG960_02925 [Caulobacteraceae bacterium]|nr:hypothetical protein [Caulobacteraceae bacterium]
MTGSRLLKALHVVGYLTTVVVIAEIVELGYLSWSSWHRSEAVSAIFREHTRTHDRPLVVGDMGAGDAFGPVRPPPGVSGDVLGFVSMPSFSLWHAASLRLPPGSDVAQGEIVFVRYNGQTDQPTFSAVQAFTLPKAAYLAAAQQIDRLTDGWPGNGDNGCFDGVPVAFERIRTAHVTSGVGNASCDPHYAAVARVVEPLLTRYAPKPPPEDKKAATSDSAPK